ncbi:hypothetical protein MJN76_31820, partial [Salmonella enterica subsp. enterica serovar Anatum]|nr:hypothetical protein [Salmonella enterica subsp. enterica serovar Anatum]
TTWLPLGPSLVSQPVNWRGRHLIWYLLLFIVSLWLQLGLPADIITVEFLNGMAVVMIIRKYFLIIALLVMPWLAIPSVSAADKG